MSHDVIEREIFINAGIDHVWSLVSKTGFWVGEVVHFDNTAGEGETVVIETDKYGTYPVLVERLDPPSYAAYRWASGFPGEHPTSDNSTLVEFSLNEKDGGVLVRLKESGFASVTGGIKKYEDNVEGWTYQLAALQSVAEGAPVT
jgi:uncharacterized protein YndB with AHSA1/START domain